MALQTLVRYTDDAAGLEKSLRLLQGFCNIAIGLTDSIRQNADLRRYTAARNHFALGRRYFRLFKWYPCWNKTTTLLSSNNYANSRGFLTIVEVLKFTFLGLYFYLEALTITNAVGLTQYEWGPWVLRESNKCWFYALVLSLLVSIGQLWVGDGEVEGGNMDAKAVDEKKVKRGKKMPAATKEKTTGRLDRRLIYTQMVIDAADLFIPGAAVGWIDVSLTVVGVASTVSTVLAGRQIAARISEQHNQVEKRSA